MEGVTIDNQLIKLIKKNCNKHISLIEEVAAVLDINYDAAYRRVNNKTSISLNDAIKLTEHFNISMNQLNHSNDNKIVVSKTRAIQDLESLELYFNDLNKSLSPLSKNADSSIIYSAKNLPIFYILKNPTFTKFKIYVWMYILNKDLASRNIPYHQFSIPFSLLKATEETSKTFETIKINEIWNYGIIDNSINEISYFYETKLLKYNDAIRMCDILKATINDIDKSCHLGNRYSEYGPEFNLYHNELLPLNNNVLIDYNGTKKLFSPYSLLNYYLIEDQKTCHDFELFLKQQIRISKLLSKSGVKERMLFFKPIYNRIEKLKERIELIKQFPIR